MNENLKQAKRDIRAFLQTAYTDERLAWLLAHARSGKLNYSSCCCLIGVATADHALQSQAVYLFEDTPQHLLLARTLPSAASAEIQFHALGHSGVQYPYDPNGVRRRRLIPIVKAEMKRRELLRAERAHVDRQEHSISATALVL